MQRNAILDSLKILLALMVVGLHGRFLSDIDVHVGYFLENYLFRMAVPIFFMINGYYFASIVDRRSAVITWLGKVSVFYLTWSLVYSGFFWPTEPGLLPAARSLAFTLLIGYAHLWYLPATFLAALCILPLKNAKTVVLAALLATAYAFGLLLQYSGNYHWFPDTRLDVVANEIPTYRNFAFFGFPMFGMGYLAAKKRLPSEMSLYWKLCLLSLGGLLLAAEYSMNVALGLPIGEGFDLLVSLPVVCLAIFVLAASGRTISQSATLGEISTVIYFIHPLFLLLLPGLGLQAATPLTLAAVVLSLLSSPLVIAANKRWRIFL
ncbi:acyltransferase family protein [Candidatus Accumulibacter aalborgensis]|nr:acyltransferase [Candidatus Accumulibacter aalborgensis]